MIEVSCATCSDIMRHPVRSEFPDTDRVEAGSVRSPPRKLHLS